MTESEKELWNKISCFNLDQEESSFKFSQRLARENGWSVIYAKSVINEYKKFIFLCCISENGVTPSDQVDQVWHLHLTFTQSYWIELCQKTILTEIHHNPTKGGQLEGKKFDNLYSQTLVLYKKKFNMNPPQDIWPDNNVRFSDINFQRVNLKNYWLVRRPYFKKRNFVFFLLIFASLFFIGAADDSFATTIVAIILFVVAIYAIFRSGGGGGGGKSSGNGCSSAGCGTSGHSGCSGCSGSGCSGCGGGGD